MNQKLLFARAYELEAAKRISEDARPCFHLTPYTGWMNDPNGFSYYKGEYHFVCNYDRGWDVEPVDEETEIALEIMRREFN